MKFTWFNLMPWPYLPDDFREKNRSVWVDIDQALFDPEKSHEVYNTYMDLLEYAGTVGFDGIGVNDCIAAALPRVRALLDEIREMTDSKRRRSVESAAQM